MRIEIHTESDSGDCETCGTNYDEGGHVVIDGNEVFRYTPVAGCWGNANYSEQDLLFMALRAIGCKITVDGDEPHVYTRYNEE